MFEAVKPLIQDQLMRRKLMTVAGSLGLNPKSINVTTTGPGDV